MDRIRKARGPVRAAVTRTIAALEAEIAKQEPDTIELEAYLQILEKNSEKLTELDEGLTEALLDAELHDDEFEAQSAKMQEYSVSIAKVKVKVNRILHPSPSSPTPSVSSYGSAAVGTSKKTFKLPKIELKKFNGEFIEWLGWWSQFSKIHQDVELHDTDKFQYLIQAMTSGSRARDLVESYPQTADNYPKVIEALKQRFGKEEFLQQVYVRELLKMVKTGDKLPLSKLYDKLETHLHALESLGVKNDSIFLFPMVESCLSEDTLIAWQRSPTHKEKGHKLELLMGFIKEEVESEATRKLVRAGFETTTKNQEKKKNKVTTDSEGIATAAGLFGGKIVDKEVCIFCSKTNHKSIECLRAQSMTLEEKSAIVMKSKLCRACLRSGHWAEKCKAPVRCSLCSKKHYHFMCPELPCHRKEVKGAVTGVQLRPEAKEFVSSNSNESLGKTTGSYSNQICDKTILLKTVLVRMVGPKKNRIVRLVCDEGNQRSYTKRSTSAFVKCKRIGVEELRNSLFGGTVTNLRNYNKCRAILESLNGETRKSFDLLEEDEICGKLPRIPPGPWIEELQRKNIPLNDFTSGSLDIEILIGSDYWGKIMTGKMEHLNCGLTAVETIFGWTLSGPVPVEKDNVAMTVISMFASDARLQELWSLETIGITDPSESKTRIEKEVAVKEQFIKTVERSDDGRYTVSLPWIANPREIPSNIFVAKKRLMNSTAKLQNAGKYREYDQIFNEWIKEGIIEEVDENQIQNLSQKPCHYLPHHPVFKPESKTTPVRPVFDASCKTGRNPSLNDCLEKGPNLMELIPAILLRFREKKFGILSDIRKAFLMINLKQEDQDFLRFLWWKNADCEKIKTFRHARVVFGVNCSPFLLAAVLEFHLGSVEDGRKPTAQKLLKALYVDNCVTSADTEEEYNCFKQESTQLMAEAKMDLRQWESNIETCFQDHEREPTTVLGLRWDKVNDVLFCAIPSRESSGKLTKRDLLSQVQQIFDPMGFLSPALLVPKLLLQKAWERKTSWDDELEDRVKDDFMEWKAEALNLSKIRVPRHAFGNLNSRENIQIHSFSDASKYAYAAVVFARVDDGNSVNIQLLLSKSRVAPLKPVTIPRLELLGCTIASRLTATIKDALFLDNVSTFYWSDSTTALAWIRRNDEWGTFVGNRVKEICKVTNPADWRFVPGILNPADLPSRGCSPNELVRTKWWEGPDWLRKPKEEWPLVEETNDEAQILKEKKKCTVAMTSISGTNPWYLERYSSFNANVRLMAYVLRFVNKVRGRNNEKGALIHGELAEAEQRIFKLVQKDVFPEQARTISGLRVKKENGIFCVQTKLLHREQDTKSFRLPILLPNSHPAVDLMIREEHIINGHCGIQFLVGKLRERVWIIQSRRAIRRIVSSCVTCRRFTTKTASVPPAPLPEDRVRLAKVFQVVGVDLAGPLFLKNKSKAWIVLYTCAVYRCVHLELVDSMSTEAFLLSLYRFISRRGRPSTIYSDNGTNFVGAANLFKELDWMKIEKETRVLRIQWKFNPPSAAWWGGWWERLIRSSKDLLKRMLGHQKLNHDQLHTSLCQVEAIINNRPLTYVTEDQDDLIPLTPAMFLQEIEETRCPEVEMLDGEMLRVKYKNLKNLKEELRNRFRKEYLGQLVQRGKQTNVRVFEVGEVVLIESDNKKRLDWPMGRILELIQGKDGEVRVAKVKTTTGILVRPLQRLYPLEISCPIETPTVTDEVKKRAIKAKKILAVEEPVREIKTRYGRRVNVPSKFL